MQQGPCGRSHAYGLPDRPRHFSGQLLADIRVNNPPPYIDKVMRHLHESDYPDRANTLTKRA